MKINEVHYLPITAMHKKHVAAFQHFHTLCEATGNRFSMITVFKSLQEGGLFAKKASVCVLHSFSK